MPRTRSQPRCEIVIESPRTTSAFLVGQYWDMAKELKRDVECAICTESWLDCRRCAALLVCGHAFHMACLREMETDRCPVCMQ